jgi:hypothetical protein
MKTALHYQDKYGSYHLSIENRIICAQISGAIGLSISIRYNQQFSLLVAQLGSEPWGHYADFRQCEALTNEAKQKSIEMHEYARNKGCVVSAFQMNSALLKNQVNTIRQTTEISEPLNQQIFNSKIECIQYIESYLSKLQNKKKRSR